MPNMAAMGWLGHKTLTQTNWILGINGFILTYNILFELFVDTGQGLSGLTRNIIIGFFFF